MNNIIDGFDQVILQQGANLHEIGVFVRGALLFRSSKTIFPGDGFDCFALHLELVFFSSVAERD